MATTIKMPQLGESVTEGTIERWLVKEGDTVEQYDPLFEVVTDKVNAEVPAEIAGTITKIMVSDGETVAVGTPLAEIDADGAAAGDEAAAAPEAQPAAPVQDPAEESQPAPVATPPMAADAPGTDISGDGIASANADVAALERVENIWPDVLQGVRARDKTLYALLNSGVRPIDVKDNVVVLEVKSDWLQKRLEQQALRRVVEMVLGKQMGSDSGIRCVVETQHRENPNALREQIRTSRKDQHVKAAINIFDADIIAVETNQEGD